MDDGITRLNWAQSDLCLLNGVGLNPGAARAGRIQSDPAESSNGALLRSVQKMEGFKMEIG
jgi:hypothetical protein